MRPVFQPMLVNGATGDPVLYVDLMFSRRALMFDLGDITQLPARKILRLTHIFISHTHMDHFIGFDYILRICLGRQRQLNLFGPPGLIDQLGHRLAGYSWNLVENYETDFIVIAHELAADGTMQRARFRCQCRFVQERLEPVYCEDGVLVDDEAFSVRYTTLDHGIPSLAYLLEERQHINVWKNRLHEMGLPTGSWLNALKQAVRQGQPDDKEFTIRWQDEDGEHEQILTLGTLRDKVLHRVPGQRIGYVVDTAYSTDNTQAILDLVQAADLLFIETVFLNEDHDRATRTHHLTAHQAGTLARQAGVKRIIPMHFSARYSDHGLALQQEAEAAFLTP